VDAFLATRATSVDPREAAITASVLSAYARCARGVYRTAMGGVLDARPRRLASLGTSPGGRGVQIARSGTVRARRSAVRAPCSVGDLADAPPRTAGVRTRATSVGARDAGVTARVTSADATPVRGACQEGRDVECARRGIGEVADATSRAGDVDGPSVGSPIPGTQAARSGPFVAPSLRRFVALRRFVSSSLGLF